MSDNKTSIKKINTEDNKAMLSRSVRLKQNTLDFLKKESEDLGIGITVLIREILEGHVDFLVNLENSSE